MTPEERTAKLNLIGKHAREVNQHLRLVPDSVTVDTAVTLIERGKMKLPEQSPEPKQKSAAPEDVQALRADVKAVAKTLLGVVRVLKSTLPEQKSEIVTGGGHFVRS